MLTGILPPLEPTISSGVKKIKIAPLLKNLLSPMPFEYSLPFAQESIWNKAL
jgi:hypothetical protein